MYTKRKIIHIDMDAFYASVEQKDNPQYRHRPLIVGGRPQSRGVVAACSYEARAFGIHSAMPCSKAARLCPHAIFIRPRIQRYKELSKEIMTIFKQYTELVEPLSLDEAFLDVTENRINNPSATFVAERIRSQIFKETGLTASAGVSCNKFLAKIASDVNKPDGITTIPPEQALDFLSNLPIGRFFGVGKVTEKKMGDLGIRTGQDLRSWDREKLIACFGKSGAFLSDIVRGIDNRPVRPNRKRKSVGSETTLLEDTKDKEKIWEILSGIAEKIEKSLEKIRTGGYTVTLKIRYSDFTTITRSRTFRNPVSRYNEILHCLPELLRMTEVGKRDIRLLGITVSNLTINEKKKPRQLLLPFHG
jgi:DNA polymerase-4